MKRVLSAFVSFFAAVALWAQSSINVSVPNVVSVNEQFNLTFTVDGSDKPSDFKWEVSDDFQLVWGPQRGHSTSINTINGKTTKTSQYTYTYILLPKKAGKFEIPSAVVTVKGNELHSKSPVVEVVNDGQPSSSGEETQNRPSRNNPANISDDDIFLKFSLSRTNAVVGEPIVATLKLYQRVNISGFEGAKFPSFNGFWSQEIEAPSNIEFQRESLDDKIYNTALLRKYILIPQQSGTLTIDPAELVCLINIRVSGGGGSIFDSFFDDYRTIRKRVTSPAFKVNVAALPSGAPASYSGGVGKFDISAKLSKDALKAHEAASVIVTVRGKGNVSLVEAPQFNLPPDFEAYDIKTTEKIDPGSGGTSGSKVFEYPFIPRSHGEFVLDPIEFSYFDVDSKRYVTLKTDPIDINVERVEGYEGPTAVNVPSGVNRTGVKSLNTDIRFISTKNPGLKAKGSFLLGSLAFWIVLALLVLSAVLAWASFRKLAERRRDVVGAKTRKATKMALKRLKLAEDYLRKNLYSAFYEELHKALLGYVSDKLNMGASELSKEHISDIFAERGISDELISGYIALLEACDFARYSPSSGYEAMAKHYDDAVNVISSIDSNMKNKKKTAPVAKMLGFILLLGLASQPAFAENSYTDSLWNAGNAFYSEGKWQQALETYSSIENTTLESAALYYNIANTYFKENNISGAILYYERALKLDPSYKDAKYNLEIARERTQDRIDVVPEFILKTWSRQICYVFDSNTWTVFFLLFVAATLALVLLFLLGSRPALRKTGFFTAIVTLLLAVCCICFASWQKSDYQTLDSAIVTRPVVSVKSSPGADASKDLFILHEGTKVKIVDSVGSWYNIELADGRQGWMQAPDMEII